MYAEQRPTITFGETLPNNVGTWRHILPRKKLQAWIIHHRNGIPSLFFGPISPSQFTLQAVVLSLGLAKDVQNDDVLVEKWKEKQRRFAKVSVQSLLQARRQEAEAEGWSTKLTVANHIIKSFLSKIS